jgi:hypothetical protein
MNNIVITRRYKDFHACIEGQAGIWGCGSTESEAVGEMLRSHPEKFGVTVQYGRPVVSQPPKEVMEYVVLSDSPLSEESNLNVSYVFAKTYLDQVRRHYEKLNKRPLTGVNLRVKSNDHDFGTYYSVIAEFNPKDEAASDAAYWLENNQPEHWDEVSQAKLSG